MKKQFWSGLFEHINADELAVAKHIFGQEPSDAEIYNFILQNYDKLHFSAPMSLDNIKVKIKHTNPKRLKREARKQLEKAENYYSHAQDVLRQSIEQNKKSSKKINREEKKIANQHKFSLKQKKKKEKLKGH